MRHPPPWWLRLPIYLDWIGLSLFVMVPLTLLANGWLDREVARSLFVVGAAILLAVADTLCGLGHRWVLFPRVGLGFLALSWILRTVRWHHLRPEHWLLVGVAIQQLWLMVACVAAEVRLRVRSKLAGP